MTRTRTLIGKYAAVRQKDSSHSRLSRLSLGITAQSDSANNVLGPINGASFARPSREVSRREHARPARVRAGRLIGGPPVYLP